MKNLMIVESPTKVKSIEKFLGPDFKVIASVGHVRDLVSSARKGIDVEQGFKPVWKVSSNKKTVIDDIKKFTKDAEVIYFATDPDREGEAISKHLYDILDKAKILKEKETHRVVFNEITKNAVTEALKKPRPISTNLWDAYLARRTLDYLMGYDISEFLWKKVSRHARAGRVQSPALRLIVERENKINEFDGMWASSLTDSTSRGKPDIEAVDFSSRAITLNEVFEVTTKPLIYDGDTGGKVEHFTFTVKNLERLGVSAVVIEDKVGLKRNSLHGTDVEQFQEDIDKFCEKINAGKDSQNSEDFMIIARIESLILDKGINDAKKRAEKYLEAGADGILIHSRKEDGKEIEEFSRFYKELNINKPLAVVPTSYNQFTEEELASNGANIIIYANHLLRSSYPAMVNTAKSILKNSRSKEADKNLISIKEILNLIPGT